MVVSDKLNVSVKAESLTQTCKGRLIRNKFSQPFRLQYPLAWFVVQTRISEYASTSLPWVVLQGWSVKLCRLDSSVLSLFSICLTCTARNTINPSCSISNVLFHLLSLLKVSVVHFALRGSPFLTLHIQHRRWEEMRCRKSKRHQEIQLGRIAKTNTPAEVCVPVIFQ